MKQIFKYVVSWFAAVVTTTVLAVILQTQNVLARLVGVGANVTIGERLSMTAYDVLHLGGLYGAFIALAFMVAFFAGGLVFRFAKFGRRIVYVVAGATAMTVMLYAMQTVFFGVPLIAGARSGFGIGLQMLAGGLGGYIFSHLSQNAKKAPELNSEASSIW